MRELQNIKSYDLFMGDLLTEDLIHDQDYCNRAFINSGTIKFPDGSSVEPMEIINVVDKARWYLNDEYRRTFSFAQKTLNIIYLAHSNEVKTMAVDENMNLYMNAGFIYNTLKMDYLLVAAVIMHEVLHALYNHIERGINWLAANGKAKTPQNWHDTNLAADIEVNHTLVKIKLISMERLVNEIHGLYLAHPGEGIEGRRAGSVNYDIVPMEVILNNEEYMKKLREMCPPPVDPETKPKENRPEIKTSEEWNQGYKDAWNKIAGLIKKYGAQGAWDKMVEAGIINGMGEIMKDKIMDVNKIQYLIVKSYDDFVNEDNKQDETGQTYEDGFNTAVGKLVNTIKSALQSGKGGSGGGGQQGQQGPKFNSDIKDDELDKITLPSPQGGESGDGEGDGLPQNIEQISSNNDQDGNNNQDGNDQNGNSQNGNDQNQSGDNSGKQSSKQAGKGGSGKSADQLTDKDSNQLVDDIASKGGKSGKTISDAEPEFADEQQGQQGGQEGQGKQGQQGGQGQSGRLKGSNEQLGIGGTGEFLDKLKGDEILKEAGYTDKQIEEINKVRKSNAVHNTKEKIRKEIDAVRRETEKSAHKIIGQFLDEIEVESEKYRNIWKKILEEFLANTTRRAGKDTPTGYNDWRKKSSIARGEYGIHHKMESKDPQDINVYVDVSGSVNMELLEVIAKSLVVFTQEWEYSGINICTWASESGGVEKIKDFYEKDEREVTKEILKIIGEGRSMRGGGTDSVAMISSVLNGIEESLNDDNKDEKDDVHIVITDGYFDFDNIEARMASAVRKTFNRPDLGEVVPTHTVWMLYDTAEDVRKRWTEEIKKGKLIFLNSEMVINNG